MSSLANLLLWAGICTPVTVDTVVARRVVVARHQGLISYLREIGLCGPETPVLPHVDNPEQVAGRLVVGVLPNWIAHHALAIVEVPLIDVPLHERGKDLPVERVRELAGPPTVYKVQLVGVVQRVGVVK